MAGASGPKLVSNQSEHFQHNAWVNTTVHRNLYRISLP
jgi:hypothetical protein